MPLDGNPDPPQKKIQPVQKPPSLPRVPGFLFTKEELHVGFLVTGGVAWYGSLRHFPDHPTVRFYPVLAPFWKNYHPANGKWTKTFQHLMTIFGGHILWHSECKSFRMIPWFYLCIPPKKKKNKNYTFQASTGLVSYWETANLHPALPLTTWNLWSKLAKHGMKRHKLGR